MGLFAVDDEKETVTFWKSLDYLESEKSMKEGGGAVGYGPGLVMTLKEFNDVHRTRENNYEGEIVHMGNTEKAMRPQKGKQEQAEEKRVKEKKKEERANSQKKKADELLALTTCADNGIEFRCAKCRVGFMSDSNLQTHIGRNMCFDKVSLTEEKDKTRNIKKVLITKAKEAMEQTEDANNKLGIVEMTLASCEFSSHGIELEEVEGCFVVKSVEEKSIAFSTYLVDEGYILTKVNDVAPETVDCLDCLVEVNLVFRRPTPQIPWRGYALKDFHQRRMFKMLDEQKEWLDNKFVNMHPTGLRAEGYKQLMVAEFQFRLRDDIDAPFWLFEPQISGWLKGKKASIKLKKKIAAAALKKKEVVKPKPKNASTKTSKKGVEKAVPDEEDDDFEGGSDSGSEDGC
jgi:hypothetical protein